MDIASTQQGMSKVVLNGKPQIPEFSHPAKMGWTIMEESKTYMNSRFMVAKILNLSYSNAIGLTLK